MANRVSLIVGQLVRVRTSSADLDGVVVAGPYAAGTDGEEWMVAPILPSREARADEYALPSQPAVAAAWCAQPIPRDSIVPMPDLLTETEIEGLRRLVADVDAGRVEIEDLPWRAALMNTWYAASVEGAEARAPSRLDLSRFLERQLSLYFGAGHSQLITIEDMNRYLVYNANAGLVMAHRCEYSTGQMHAPVRVASRRFTLDVAPVLAQSR